MARFLKTVKRGNVINFRDRDASPSEGVSLWETFPALVEVCDPWAFFGYEDDFTEYVAGDWTITDVGSNTTVVTDAVGGVILVTTGATEDNGRNFNKKGEAFKLAAGKELWYEIRLQTADVLQSDLYVGLSVTDTDMLGGTTDSVSFRKVDGSANVSFVTEKDSTETTTSAITAMVNDTWLRLGFYFDGSTSVTPYVNGVAGTAHTTNICDDEELCVAMQFLTGEAVAKTFRIDKIKIKAVR